MNFMKTFYVNSLDFKTCMKTCPNALKKLTLCQNCGNLPLPSYKSLAAQEFLYCKECYFLTNNTSENLIFPHEYEYRLLEKLVISCTNYSCEKVFDIKTLEEMVRHEEECPFSLKNNDYNINPKEFKPLGAQSLLEIKASLENTYLKQMQVCSTLEDHIKRMQNIIDLQKDDIQNLNSSAQQLIQLQMDKTSNLSEKESFPFQAPFLKDNSFVSTTSNFKQFRSTCVSIEGHTKNVNSIIQLMDGNLASCSKDKTIRIWNIQTRECLHILLGHNNSVSAITQISKERIVSGSGDNTIRIWDVNSGKCEGILKGHAKGVTSLCFLMDKRLISGSDDTRMKIWNISDNKCIFTFQGHSDSITSIIQLTTFHHAARYSGLLFWYLR